VIEAFLARSAFALLYPEFAAHLPRICRKFILAPYLQYMNQSENLHMNAMKKVLVSVVTCMLLGAAVLGCNTVKGAGKDIERGVEKIQNSADKHNN
jgi:entericidin B